MYETGQGRLDIVKETAILLGRVVLTLYYTSDFLNHLLGRADFIDCLLGRADFKSKGSKLPYRLMNSSILRLLTRASADFDSTSPRRFIVLGNL